MAQKSLDYSYQIQTINSTLAFWLLLQGSEGISGSQDSVSSSSLGHLQRYIVDTLHVRCHISGRFHGSRLTSQIFRWQTPDSRAQSAETFEGEAC
ncbi:Uncharacterized protein HZ326_2389 [Fusarium oxysporum f. sp. albedinis]|nr:Uncharacterized protein HZ326_2389 [Fusarium oxysporum f. sp. albedinis]